MIGATRFTLPFRASLTACASALKVTWHREKAGKDFVMSLVYNSLAFAGVVWRRVLSHLGLLLAVWAGFTLAVALVVSVPVYAEAAGYRILVAALAKPGLRDPVPP